jgi:hypothetical protein
MIETIEVGKLKGIDEVELITVTKRYETGPHAGVSTMCMYKATAEDLLAQLKKCLK